MCIYFLMLFRKRISRVPSPFLFCSLFSKIFFNENYNMPEVLLYSSIINFWYNPNRKLTKKVMKNTVFSQQHHKTNNSHNENILIPIRIL